MQENVSTFSVQLIDVFKKIYLLFLCVCAYVGLFVPRESGSLRNPEEGRGSPITGITGHYR